MKFQQLECLATLADTGSFHGAIDRLGYSQQLICYHVEQLEQELGHSLIQREGTTVYLTKSGQQVLWYAREILKDRDALYAELDAEIVY